MFDKKYKDEIVELKNIIHEKDLEIKNKESDYLDLKRKYDLIETFLLNAEKYESNEQILYFQENNLIQVKEKIKEAEIKLKEVADKIVDANDFVFYENLNFFNNQLKYKNTDEYKYRLEDNIKKQKYMVKYNESCYEPYGQHPLMKQDIMWFYEEDLHKYIMNLMVTGFNSYCNEVIEKANENNIRKSRDLIKNKFDEINKSMWLLHIKITGDYLDLKFEQLNLKVEYELKKQQDKEEKQRQQEILKEQNMITEEIKKAQDKLNKELKHYKNQLEKIKNDNDKIEVENKISEIINQMEQNDYRFANQKAGFVYVLHNPSLGENIYKIGVTRRLNWEDRVNELSNASVPFIFQPNCIIFTEDAFALESALHKEFDKYRVNKINKRKEYFKLSIEQIAKTIREKYDESAEFNYYPINEQYILSMKGNNNEIT